MRLSIKKIDVSGDLLKHYRPEDPDRFSVWITATIGPDDSQGGDLFQFLVSARAGFKKEIANGAEKQQYVVVVETYDADMIQEELQRIVKECEGDTWMVSARNLTKFGRWEFDECHPGERTRAQ